MDLFNTSLVNFVRKIYIHIYLSISISISLYIYIWVKNKNVHTSISGQIVTTTGLGRDLNTFYGRLQFYISHTWKTKSLPRKSTMVLGSRVRPQTNRRNNERSALEKLSRVSQNQRTNGAVASTPLYVTTDFNKSSGMSGLPHTIVSSSGPVNNDSKGTGITRAMPSRTADTFQGKGTQKIKKSERAKW